MSSEPARAIPFDYRLLPLNRSKKEIRLLKLKLEGTLHSWHQSVDIGITNSDLERQLKENLDLERPTECELLKASLEAPPDFHALSYVWGPSTKSRRLILRISNYYPDIPLGTIGSSESFEVEITDNLHLALAYYRGSESDVCHGLIWVDAVCINQKDNDEKSWQVQMMREIYKSATSTSAWLGPIPEGRLLQITRLLHTLEELANEGIRRFGWELCAIPLRYLAISGSPRTYVDQDLINWIEESIYFDSHGPNSEAHGNRAFEFAHESLMDLKRLLTLSFWKRVWILQEVTLSKNVLFHYGPQTLESLLLHVGLKLVGKAIYLGDSTQFVGIFFSNHLQYVADAQHSVPGRSELYDPRKMIAHLPITEPEFCPLLSHRFKKEPSGESKIRLSNMLHWNYYWGGLEATMESDYVFGLLGLVNDHGSMELVPDYTKPYEEVYTEATIKWINEAGLKVLGYCRNITMPSKLPSWVPNLNSPDNLRRITITSMHDFAFLRIFLSGPIPDQDFKFLYTPSGPKLISMGYEVTTIKRSLITMPSWISCTPLLRRIWDVQVRLVFMKDVIEECASAYRTKEDRHIAFASTLSGGGEDRGRLISPGDVWSFERIFRGYKALIEPSSVPVSFNAFSSILKKSVFWPALAVGSIVDACCLSYDESREPPPTPTHKFYINHPGFFFMDYFYDGLKDIYKGENKPYEQMMEDIILFIDLVQSRNDGRKILVSEEGFLVLGPLLTEAGDIVTFLDGSDTPFILRPSLDGSFRLVGEAYVFGIMDRGHTDGVPILGIRPSLELEATINRRGRDIRREFSIK